MPEDSMSFLPKDPQGECRGTRRTLSMSKCAWHAWLTSIGCFPLLRTEMASSCPLRNAPSASSKFENK